MNTDELLIDLLKRVDFSQEAHRSIKKDFSKEKYVNSKICKECGGKCCQICGCHFSPDDFPEISFEFLKQEIKKGYISIDYVDGEIIYENFGVYILRIRNRNAPIVDIGLKRSPCMLLTDNGCTLTYEKRPAGGKALIPSIKTNNRTMEKMINCYSKYDIRECSFEWKPYQRILIDLKEYFLEKEFPCSL